MPRARSILKRVKAVKSTRTITRTMEMISTARFKKTHDRVVAARPYTDAMQHVVAELVGALQGQDISHPLLSPAAGGENVVLVMTANRGLAGSYNTNVLRAAAEHLVRLRKEERPLALQVVGKRGMQYFRFRKAAMAKTYSDFDYQPAYDKVSALADEFIADFTHGKIAGLEVVYTRFLSAGQQKPVVERLLPLTIEKTEAAPKTSQPVYDFVPGPRKVLERLLPAEVRLRLYQAFLDAAVSEQIARMTSMRAATENADDIIHTLTLRYNRLRQAQITTELAEIMGGRAALAEG